MRAEVIAEVVEWLRGAEAEQIASDAEREGIAPEDALAFAIEEGRTYQPHKMGRKEGGDDDDYIFEFG